MASANKINDKPIVDECVPLAADAKSMILSQGLFLPMVRSGFLLVNLKL